MSDLFHEAMPFEYLDKIFEVIRKSPQHTYQILTKRDKIMLSYFEKNDIPDNVWLGVTVEKSQYKERIENLKKMKAKIIFISFEPLIGKIGEVDLEGIQWAIVGGESGKKARKIKREWVEEIFKQCKEQGVAFFFKQWGTWGEDEIKRNKKLNGRLFKNKIWDEYPMQKIVGK